MGKIFQLSNPKSDDTAQIANDKDNNVNGWLMLMFVLFIYVLAFVSITNGAMCFCLKPLLNTDLRSINLWLISMVLIFIVGIITQWLLHYFAFKYRGKKANALLFTQITIN